MRKLIAVEFFSLLARDIACCTRKWIFAKSYGRLSCFPLSIFISGRLGMGNKSLYYQLLVITNNIMVIRTIRSCHIARFIKHVLYELAALYKFPVLFDRLCINCLTGYVSTV